MITTLPMNSPATVNAVLPRNITAQGVVDRKIAQGAYVIALAGGSLTVKVASGELSVGDAVALTSGGRGAPIQIEKLTAQPYAAPAPASDALDAQPAPSPAVLKQLADAAVEQLRKQVLDKDTLGQLQKILVAVAKNPEQFGAETREAVAELKAIVAKMPPQDANVSKAAQEIADRIIVLGEKLAANLRSSGGVVDVVLKAGAQATEGYYQFDDVKSALSWLSENKLVKEDIPWKTLSQVYKDGPVVIKVYESAIGDLRASFVAPDKTREDLSHFVASSLRADVWKNVSPDMLAKLLSDRKDIPISRLVELDTLLQESESPQEPPAPGSVTNQKTILPQATQTRGFDTVFGQWLNVALNEKVSLEQIVPRAPLSAAPPIPALLTSIAASDPAGEFPIAKSLRPDDFALAQDGGEQTRQPQAAIPDLFVRMGLNLEATFAKGNEIPAGEGSPQNLKASLLALLSAIDNALARTATSVQDTASTLQGKQDTDTGGDSMPAPSTVLRPQTGEEETETARAARTSAGTIQAKLDEIFKDLSETAQAVTTRVSQAATGDTSAQDSPAEKSRPDSAPAGAGTEIIAKIKQLAGQLQDLGKQVSRQDSGSDKGAGGREPDSTKLMPQPEVRTIRDAVRQLDTMVKNLPDHASTVLHDVAKRLTELSAEATKLSDKVGTDAAGQAQRGPLDTLKQQVENALTRVESLQVLARQVTVSDGQQQVISLPMKIEGRWTDVVVKFVKKKPSGKPDTLHKPVSVAIHVAPAMLGGIDAFMEYDGAKRFSMRMEFEKTDTRAWFEAHRDDFSGAIAAIGFAAFKIDMKETVAVGPQAAPLAKTGVRGPRASGIIDITA